MGRDEVDDRSHDGADDSSGRSSSRRRGQRHLATQDVIGFMTILGELIRIQEESLAMAYIYMHKYRRFISNSHDTDEEPVPDFLDEHTLALTSLSLSTKATESPRRLRSLIIPAYSLMNPTHPPLNPPSTLYDTLRNTIVTAELHLLRILRFELRCPLPHDHLARYFSRTISVIPGEDYDSYSPYKTDEDKVVDLMDTSLGRQISSLATRAMTRYSIAVFYDMRTVAAGVIATVMEAYQVRQGEGTEKWLTRVTGGGVDVEDFGDVVKELRGLLEWDSLRVRVLEDVEVAGKAMVVKPVVGSEEE